MNYIIITIFFSLFHYQSAYPVKNIEIIPVIKTARITCYNDYGKTASGEITLPGIVATSDRTIKMGTKVYIQDLGILEIKDKTAKWIQPKYGFTLDVWLKDCNKYFGVKKLTYKILE